MITKCLNFAFICLIGALCACSHMTPYEACNEVSNGQYEYMRYGSVEECMSTKKAEQSRPNAAQRFFSGFSQGYNQGRSQSVNCTPNGYGGYRCN